VYRLVFLQEFIACVCVCVRVLVQDTGLNAYPWMEIYDGLLIKYMAPLDMHDVFFVPEAVAAANDLTTSTDDAGDAGADS